MILYNHNYFTLTTARADGCTLCSILLQILSAILLMNKIRVPRDLISRPWLASQAKARLVPGSICEDNRESLVVAADAANSRPRFPFPTFPVHRSATRGHADIQLKVQFDVRIYTKKKKKTIMTISAQLCSKKYMIVQRKRHSYCMHHQVILAQHLWR